MDGKIIKYIGSYIPIFPVAVMRSLHPFRINARIIFLLKDRQPFHIKKYNTLFLIHFEILQFVIIKSIVSFRQCLFRLEISFQQRTYHG